MCKYCAILWIQLPKKKCRETVSLKKKKGGVKFNHVSSLTSLFYVNLNDLWALERLFNRESNRKVFTWLIAELPEKQRLQKSPLIVVTSLSDERAVKRYQSLLWTELIFFFFAETPTINWLTCHQIFFSLSLILCCLRSWWHFHATLCVDVQHYKWAVRLNRGGLELLSPWYLIMSIINDQSFVVK